MPLILLLRGVVCSAEYETFFGTATPPTSYGGYGGNAEEDAKYTFEYPAGWKPAVPNKVEKGTQGIDCRVSNVCGCLFAVVALSGGVSYHRSHENNQLIFITRLLWLQPKNKNQKITVVTFGRAGEDNKSFRLANIETTIAGFAGADYDLCVLFFCAR